MRARHLPHQVFRVQGLTGSRPNLAQGHEQIDSPARRREEEQVGEAQVGEHAPGSHQTLQMLDNRVGEARVLLDQFCQRSHDALSSPLRPHPLAEAEQSGQIVNIGVEFGSGDHHFAPGLEVVTDCGFPAGHHREVPEILSDLGQHA